VVVTVTFAQATILFADAGKTTRLAVLVNRLGDPVDPGIATNSLVVRIDQDDFIVLVDTILVDPVRVEDTQVATSPSNTLLRNTPQATLRLDMLDTLTNRLAVGSTLGHLFLAVTPPDTNTVDDISLLGLVSETASLIRARRTRCSVDNVQLAVLPAPNTKEESEDIRLLLFVELPDILVCAHVAACRKGEGKRRISSMRAGLSV